jgi:hypothetical protein
VDSGAREAAQKEVALVRLGRAFFSKNEMRLQPEADGRGRGRPGVVGLNSPAGDHRVRSLCFRLGKQKFKLADLVAAQDGPGEIVALDEQFGTALQTGEAVELLNGGGQVGQPQALGTGRSTRFVPVWSHDGDLLL